MSDLLSDDDLLHMESCIGEWSPTEHRIIVAQARAAIRLRDAIRAHRSQKADDRCIEDDDRLYEALGDGVKCDRRVGDKQDMLINCARFIEKRCEGGGWPSYVKLEAEVERLTMENAELRTALETHVEYSGYLAGEWKWKQGERAGNAKEFADLQRAPIPLARTTINGSVTPSPRSACRS